MIGDEQRPHANPAKAAKRGDELATLAGLADGQKAVSRDASGRFLTGNSGGGRPKGSKNRLTDLFVSAVADDFADHGAAAIARVRRGDPVAYLKLIGSLVPRELVLQREREPAVDFDEISLGDWIDLLDRLKREAAMKAQLIAAERGR